MGEAHRIGFQEIWMSVCFNFLLKKKSDMGRGGHRYTVRGSVTLRVTLQSLHLSGAISLLAKSGISTDEFFFLNR